MDYFKNDGNFIYLEAPYAEFYVPKSLFDDGFADNLGTILKVLGILNVGFFVNGELKEMRILNLPSMIDLFIADSEDRNVKFPHDEREESCTVLKYNKGDKIMPASTIKDSDNSEKFMGLVNKGKLPSLIPYSKALTIWNKNMSMNDVYLGVPSVIFELILSAAYRYKKDPTKKFGMVAGGDLSISDYDYAMSRIREICRFTSTFAGVTYEDIDAMITTSLVKTKNKKPEAYSAIEDIIKL